MPSILHTRSWRTKATLQKLIARLPVALGDSLYHGLQQLSGLRPHIEPCLRFADRIEELQRRSERSWRCNRVVELGSGWFPIIPLLLLCRGSQQVDTFDTNAHYSRRRIRAAAAALQPYLEGCHVLRQPIQFGALPAAVSYHPRTALQSAPLPADSVNLAVSKSVLEHVAPDTIAEIHHASREWMTDDGVWIHLISCNDHRAYTDKRLCLVDFLRYSTDQWQRIAGNRFAQHNRLRCSQYHQLFSACGWQVVFEDKKVNPAALKALDDLPVHKDFAHMEAEDLVAGALWFVLAKA